ncbi:MAG: zinc-dependent alcohol dehydrogenase family protein [Spirochaetia bacterium]
MRAAVFSGPGQPLTVTEVPAPSAGPGQLLLRVKACGVCRTDLHIVDGELPDPRLPLIPGHQIVGVVEKAGPGSGGFAPGDRVGVPWLGFSCGTCVYCASGRENLCERARFTGYHFDGGFAELAAADARFCFPLPADFPDLQAAPLLCAGLIGFRALRMTGDAARIGFYGFGSAAHILVQVARFQHREVFAFVRPGDRAAREFSLRLGAGWAGDSTTPPPRPLDAAIIFAPDGALVPLALAAVARGGTVVCAGIHMSDIPSFPYRALWEERSIRSVANLTRQDAREFLSLAPRVPVRTEVEVYPLAEVNKALARLRSGEVSGSVVIDPQR